jgi:hypothetical protein
MQLKFHHYTAKCQPTLWLAASLLLPLACPFLSFSFAQSEPVCPHQGEACTQSVSSPTGLPVFRATFEENRELQTVTGELVASDKNLGHLLLDADGQLTAIEPKELKRIEEVSGAMVPTSAKEIAAKVLRLMPSGSKSIITDHFVVCYNTSDVYARWNSSLYEKLYKGLFRFWKEKGIELSPPRFPLVALVFESKKDYVQYASNEFEGAENTIGYYHQSTNRLASYDLTGIEGMLPPGTPVLRDELINQILSRPQAERTVATIVHEACHQISFNCGLQVRLGDNPLWLSEGIATFFESPDGSSTNGWGGTGKVNRHNLNHLALYLPKRTSDSLERLLMEDNRLRSGETSTFAYAEAWGLTYYLIKSKPKQFVTYLKMIRDRPLGKQSSSKERIELFQECFGDDLAKFDKEFIRFMAKVR